MWEADTRDRSVATASFFIATKYHEYLVLFLKPGNLAWCGEPWTFFAELVEVVPGHVWPELRLLAGLMPILWLLSHTQPIFKKQPLLLPNWKTFD
jgi:hypothetical protein